MTDNNNKNEYSFEVFHDWPAKHQGFFTTKAEVEQWEASGNVSDRLLAFVKQGMDAGQGVFVYTHTHSGSGMDRPTVKASLSKEGTLDVTWFDACESFIRTMDLRTSSVMVAACFNPTVVNAIHVKGLQIHEHTFVVGGVTNEAQAWATLRGLEDLKGKTDDELKALTKASTKIGDLAMFQAMAYLPNLEELYTTGINWTPETLQLLGKLVTVKKLRVGGRYWAETNNFKYADLEYLTGLIQLESLDMSFSAIDGRKPGRSVFYGEKLTEKDIARLFARGMNTILKFPELQELVLGTEMYPKGAKVLTSHPNLHVIRQAKHISYEVVQILANSRLATQLTALDFEYTRSNQLAAPIMKEIAKFINLTHLFMERAENLDDAALMELAPLVNLKRLFVPFSRITSKGLAVLRHMPNVRVLSLGYCTGITDGLDNICHLSLTHLDVRSHRELTMQQLLPVIKASPDLVDLNLRYAEGLDAMELAEVEFGKSLKYLNPLSLRRTDGPKGEKPLGKLKMKNVELYYEDDPFHIQPEPLDE